MPTGLQLRYSSKHSTLVHPPPPDRVASKIQPSLGGIVVALLMTPVKSNHMLEVTAKATKSPPRENSQGEPESPGQM